MSAALATSRMTVEEFIAWSDEQDGKFELDDGLVIAMSPERLVHARAKGEVYVAFRRAIRAAGVPCEAFMEGPAIRIDATTLYQPDVMVQCGPKLQGHVREIDVPVVVVEVLSPSTAYRDLGRKARNYLRVPAIRHYLIVDTDDRVVTHRRRGDDGAVLSDDHADGEIVLDPPGLRVSVTDLLPPAEDTFA